MSSLGVPTVYAPKSIQVQGQTQYFGSQDSEAVLLTEFVQYGAEDLGASSIVHQACDKEWALSDGTLLTESQRNLGGRVHGRSGAISVRAPRVNPTNAIVGAPGQSGVGSVSVSRPSRRRTLFAALSPLYVTPTNETAGANISTIWATQTGIVDVSVKSSLNSPSYRIYGSGLYGPTGYWVTKSRSDIRINQTVNVEWYATDYECAALNYSLTVNGSVVATGVMNSGAYANHSIVCSELGDVQLSVTLSDENNESYELVGPLLQVQNVPVYAGEILLPIESGRYRIGTPVSVKVHYPVCEAWSVVHRFQGSTVEVGRGTLTIPGEATTEFTLVPNPELGTHYLDLILYDVIGPQDPADTVEFFVTEYDELLSS